MSKQLISIALLVGLLFSMSSHASDGFRRVEEYSSWICGCIAGIGAAIAEPGDELAAGKSFALVTIAWGLGQNIWRACLSFKNERGPAIDPQEQDIPDLIFASYHRNPIVYTAVVILLLEFLHYFHGSPIACPPREAILHGMGAGIVMTLLESMLRQCDQKGSDEHLGELLKEDLEPSLTRRERRFFKRRLKKLDEQCKKEFEQIRKENDLRRKHWAEMSEDSDDLSEEAAPKVLKGRRPLIKREKPEPKESWHKREARRKELIAAKRKLWRERRSLERAARAANAPLSDPAQALLPKMPKAPLAPMTFGYSSESEGEAIVASKKTKKRRGGKKRTARLQPEFSVAMRSEASWELKEPNRGSFKLNPEAESFAPICLLTQAERERVLIELFASQGIEYIKIEEGEYDGPSMGEILKEALPESSETTDGIIDQALAALQVWEYFPDGTDDSEIGGYTIQEILGILSDQREI